MNALDVGCGIGKCMKSLEEAGFNVSGIESSETFYKKALSHMAIKADQIKLGMVEEVEYNKKFDFITFGAVFEHLYEPAKALERASGWLNSGGIVHIEVPSSRHLLAKIINIYYRLAGTNYVTNLSPMHSPFHLYEFNLDSFKLMSKRLGFSVEDYHFEVGDIPFVPKIIQPIARWYMVKTNTGNQLTVYLKKIE
jgi:SAM-dependent methyltransferase